MNSQENSVVRSGNKNSLKVCFIGTYPPRKCGIGTFTSDLRRAVNTSDGGVQASIIAMTDNPNTYTYPSEVIFEVHQEKLDDYRLAAEYLNCSDINLVCLQHEFGIFGGPAGVFIADLLNNLLKPVITTLHTVHTALDFDEVEALARIVCRSDRLVILNSKATLILRKLFDITDAKVTLIHHGIPDVPLVDSNSDKAKCDLEGRFVLLTFGLLTPCKGIEIVLEALPRLINKHPEVVYVVLGVTHPSIKQQQGEQYRFSLEQKVRELGLGDHVVFHNRYVDSEELCRFINACDIYVTPYQYKEQIASGTLAYAAGMGKAVVSTPYLYAEEMLAEGRGRLVNFGDANALSQILLELIENDAARFEMCKRAYEYGRRMTWPVVGSAYIDLFKHVAFR